MDLAKPPKLWKLKFPWKASASNRILPAMTGGPVKPEPPGLLFSSDITLQRFGNAVDGFGSIGTGRSQIIDIGNAPVDFIHHLSLFFGGCHTGIDVGDTGDGFQNGLELLFRFSGQPLGFGGLLAAGLHHVYHIRNTSLQRRNHGLNIFCGLAGALRQSADLIRHHGEAAALLTGPGSLNGGVQSQQVGLLGNAANDIQHRVIFVGIRREFADNLNRLGNLGSQAVHLFR